MILQSSQFVNWFFVHRLDLNLRSGKQKVDNIVLNLSVNFHENAITRNTRINDQWGDKECEENLYDSKDDSLNPVVSGKYNLFSSG